MYEIISTPDTHSHHQARVWLPTNPHSHSNPVPGDQYQWTPASPRPTNKPPSTISLSFIQPQAVWRKLLCQPTPNADPTGHLTRRLLSVTTVDQPDYPLQPQPMPQHNTPVTTLVQLEGQLPTIYVDGGLTYHNSDFLSVFQEQRDPTNRSGIAGIAIVPTGPTWQQQGTIITLRNGAQLTEVLTSLEPALSEFPVRLPFLQAVLHHLQAFHPQGVRLDWTKAHPEQRTNEPSSYNAPSTPTPGTLAYPTEFLVSHHPSLFTATQPPTNT
jgi:hypothetical protein